MKPDELMKESLKTYLDSIGISFFILPPHPRPLPLCGGEGKGEGA